MKNKKLNELRQEPHSTEELFLSDLLNSLRRNREEIEEWIVNFKKQHGVKDEDL